MEPGQAEAGQDMALTNESAVRQSHRNQTVLCFEPQRPKSLWAKMHIQWQQTQHLHLIGSLSYIHRSNCTRNPYTQKFLTKSSCSPKSCIRAPKCNKMSQDGINSYSWWLQSCSKNPKQSRNLAPRNRCYLSFVCSSPTDQLPAVHQLNIRGLTQLWCRVISLFGLWAVSHIFTFP